MVLQGDQRSVLPRDISSSESAWMNPPVTSVCLAVAVMLRKYKSEKDGQVLRDQVRVLAHPLKELKGRESKL